MQDGDRQTLVVLVPVFAAVVVVALFTIAATRGDATDRDVWFTAIGAGFAVLGVAGAAFAVYRSDVLERPDPKVFMEVERPDDADDVYDWVPHDTTAMVVGRVVVGSERTFDARVHVINEGRAVLRWGKLNIQVLRECDIDPMPLDTGPPDHHKALTPFNCAQLRPGEDVLCNATRSEREYAPGHTYLYLIRVTVPHPGVWPVAAVVDGFPTTKRVTRGWTRADINVT